MAVATGLTIVACGLVLLSQAKVGGGYGLILAVILIMGTGMGLAMTPATDSIMGSLPREKAGVGSAVNDTTREVGGALGVAILGSLLAAGYHSSMSNSAAAASLPPAQAAVAHDSLGGAVQVAGQIGSAGQSLVADASHAFVNAMSSTVLVGAGVALIGAIIALVWLPSRALAPAAEPEEVVDAEAVLDADLLGVD